MYIHVYMFDNCDNWTSEFLITLVNTVILTVCVYVQLCGYSCVLVHSHVCGFGLYVRAVYNCGFTRPVDDCYHYYHMCCAGHCVITVLYCTVLMVLPVVLHTYIVYVL